MTNEQAYALIAERADELRKNPHVERKAFEMHRAGKSMQECMEWVNMLAVSTLCGEAQADSH